MAAPRAGAFGVRHNKQCRSLGTLHLGRAGGSSLSPSDRWDPSSLVLPGEYSVESLAGSRVFARDDTIPALGIGFVRTHFVCASVEFSFQLDEAMAVV